MDFKKLSRRRLFELAGAVSVVGGAATPFAMQLAAAGAAAAASAPDYKALICIFQFGGNDSNNSVVATDADSYDRYFATRNIGVLNRPGFAGGSNSQVGWSHDQSDHQQVLP